MSLRYVQPPEETAVIRIQERVVAHYEQLLPRTTGLEHLEILKRLEEANRDLQQSRTMFRFGDVA